MTEHHMVLGRDGLQYEDALTQSWDTWGVSSFVDHLCKYQDQTVYFYQTRSQYYNKHGKMRKHSAKQAINFLRASGRAK